MISFCGALVTCAVLAQAALGAETCPQWISVVPLAADDAAGIVDDVVAQGNETIIDGIAWICSIHPAGNPAVDKAAQYAEIYRTISPRVRTKSKVRQGILLQSTMGHGGFPGEATPWQLTVKPDGKSVYRMCPLDPRFLDYVAKACRTFDALKSDFFMVDDDTRIVWGDAAPGCFCPIHLKALAAATGRAWTREAVVAGLKANDASLAAAWEKVNVDSMAALFRTIRDNFDPATPGILCTSKAAPHFRHVTEYAAILAARGQTPVVRGAGANYCGNDLYHPIYRRGQWAQQLAAIGAGVVYLQEADTCPQTLWSCSAAREYGTMFLEALEGVKGAKIWITRTQQTRERRSQAAYRRIFRENRGIMEWAAKSDFKMSGVVVPAVATDGFAERYLGLMGIPYRYGTARPGDVTALCRSDLERLPRAEIARILGGRVLLDGTAANWLAANGFAADIGVTAKPWVRKTIQRHLDEDGTSIGGMRVDATFADLTACAKGAQILSRLYNIPAMGAAPVYEAPGSIIYANARGGTVLTFALPLKSNHPAYFESTMFSEGGKAWIIRMLRRLGCNPAAYFAGAGDVMCEVGTTAADGDVFVLDMIDIDTLPAPEMAFARPLAAIERLGGDGVWRPVSFTRTAEGTYLLNSPLAPQLPAVFRATFAPND